MKKLFIILGLIFLSIGIASCQKEVTVGLNTVGSKTMLKSLVGENRDTYNFGPFPGAEATDDVAGDAKGDERTSKTNSQVEGVTEGDIIKVDENYIYQIDNDVLRITKISDTFEVLKEIKHSNENSYIYLSELYLTSDYLVVIGNRYDYYVGDLKYDYFYYRPVNTTVIYIYDLDTLEIAKTYELSGYQSLSRQIDQKIILMTTTYINLEVDDPRPYDYIDGSKVITQYDDIYYHENLEKQVFNSIYVIDLGEVITEEKFTFLGSYYYGVSYVSLNGIYLTSYHYNFIESENTYEEKYYLHAFLFNDNEIVYGGVASFRGYVLNQFSIDEYNGYIRFLTTEGFGDTIVNHLYVYQKVLNDTVYELELKAHLDEGIGKPRERIFSARFNKDELTVVTFEQTDPFYVIDLSDNENPLVVGQLEVPGFSTYQHIYQENVVLGIGVETEGQMQVGLKLALYDTKNQNNPLEIGTPLVLRNSEFGYTYGEALYNHKAILFDMDNDYFGFSVERYYYYEYNYQYVSEYLIFGVDILSETPITIIKTISHIDQTSYNYLGSIRRAVYVGDYLYAISGEMITKHDIHQGFNETARVRFNDEA